MYRIVPWLSVALFACSSPSESVVELCDVAPGEARAHVTLEGESVSPNSLEVVSHGGVFCEEPDVCCNPATFARTSWRVSCAGGTDVVLEGALGICEGDIDSAPLSSGAPIDERCAIACPALEGELVGSVVDEGGQRVFRVTFIE